MTQGNGNDIKSIISKQREKITNGNLASSLETIYIKNIDKFNNTLFSDIDKYKELNPIKYSIYKKLNSYDSKIYNLLSKVSYNVDYRRALDTFVDSIKLDDNNSISIIDKYTILKNMFCGKIMFGIIYYYILDEKKFLKTIIIY